MTSPFDNTDFVKKEFANASDRAVAIVGGAFLDELVTELLKAFLVPDTANDKELFSGSGVLATFSAKIDLAYRLGLITKSERATIHTVRSIRNTFAHQMHEASFTTQSMRDKCSNISVPQHMLVPDFVPPRPGIEQPMHGQVFKIESNDPRGLFQEAISHLMRVLAARSIQAKNSGRKSPKDFEAAHEIFMVVLEEMKELEQRLRAVIEEYKTAGGDPTEAVAQSLELCCSNVFNTELFIQQIKAAHQGQI